MTGLGVLEGEAEDGVQRLGAVVAQQRQPGADGARDGGGKEAGAGDQVETQVLEGLDGRAGGGDPLTGQETGSPRAVAPREEDRDLTTGTVEVRLDDLEGEAGGGGGVERVASGFEDGHARC